MIPVPKERIDDYTQKGWWGRSTVLDLFFETVRKRPDAEALVDPLNRGDLMGGTAKRLTYREAATLVDRLALGLERLGIKKDDVILVQLPNVVESVLLFFAAARIGAISSPLSMMARSREVGHALEATRSVAVVTVEKFNGFDHLALMKGLKERFDCLKQIVVAGDESDHGFPSLDGMLSREINPPLPAAYFDGKASGPNEIFTICWTSGTEAEPKGVPRTHNHWISIGRVTTEGCRVKEGDNIHGTFPVINMAGIGGLMVPWVLTGGKFVLHHPFDLGVFFKQMATEDLYYTLMPPALLDTLAKSTGASAMGESNVRVIASGSVPLSPWMVRYYQETFNISIVNFFASNEGIALFSGPGLFPDPDDRARFFPRFGCREVSFDISDRVIGGMESCIADVMTGEEITESGKVGELCFKGTTMFEGYWKQRELTEKAFDTRGYYHSGDLFSIEGEAGEKLLFHGRFKDLIIRGGQNISPEEVETLVAGHPGVAEAAAVGVPDERLGERTCVFVVVHPGRTVTLAEISRYLEEQGVAKYKYPERLEILDQLPRSALNKVLRRKLRDMLNHKPGKEQ